MRYVFSIFCVAIIVYIFLLISCAQVGSPTGGVKDTIPPEVLRYNPGNHSVNFDGKEISIEFNEFFNVKNANQALVVSPPMKEQPLVITKGKKLFIEIRDTLKDSTTYNFFFGDAIQDLNENNPFKDFEYVVSTGNSIDSLRITGKVLTALEHKPLDEAFVMIYEHYADSTPINTIPDFFGKTNKQGIFTIRNVKAGKYRIFALKDANRNMRFDMASEEISYLDTFLTPSVTIKELTDTVKIQKNDSLQIDSLVFKKSTVYLPDTLFLYSFKEDKDKQYLKEYTRYFPGQCCFVFNRPLNRNLDFKLLGIETSNSWFSVENSYRSDSVTVWITDSLLYNKDTLSFIINYDKKDSVDNYVTYSDTLNIKFAPKKDKEKGKSKDTEKAKKAKNKDSKAKELPKKETLRFITNTDKSKKLIPGNDLYFIFDQPIQLIDNEKVIFNEVVKDTIKVKQLVKFEQDSILLRKFWLRNKWKEGSTYELRIDSGVISNIFNLANDSIAIRWSIDKTESYGNINFNFSNKLTPLIVQLTTKDKVNYEFYSGADSVLHEKLIKPGNYDLRIIYDYNGNKRWDTGDYLKHIQPDKVIFYADPVKIKENFDSEYPVDLKQ